MIREILIWPNPKLSVRTRPVDFTRDQAELAELRRNLIDTCLAARGAGLAATQIGSSLRVCVVDLTETEDGKQLTVLVNPEIVRDSAETTEEFEGCLSVPGEAYQLTRPNQVEVAASDENGKPTYLVLKGKAARAAQHEIDHLDGVCYPDRLSYLQRDVIRRKMKKVGRIVQRHRDETQTLKAAQMVVSKKINDEMGFD